MDLEMGSSGADSDDLRLGPRGSDLELGETQASRFESVEAKATGEGREGPRSSEYPRRNATGIAPKETKWEGKGEAKGSGGGHRRWRAAGSSGSG